MKEKWEQDTEDYRKRIEQTQYDKHIERQRQDIQRRYDSQQEYYTRCKGCGDGFK